MSLFNPNVPQATDFLSDSQVDIRNNFSQANTTMTVNHFPFNDGTVNNGKHKWTQIVKVASLASILPAPAANEGAIYTQTATSEAAGNETNLFYTPDASGDDYQLTRTVTGEFSSFGTTVSNKGWTFLPGGLLMQYGNATSNTSGSPNGSVTFTVQFTGVPFSVQAIVHDSTAGAVRIIKIANVTQNSFSIILSNEEGSLRAENFYWVAIGK